MSEEPEFKSMRITLSDEAYTRLEELMKKAMFRSYSSTVEECIRAVYDLMTEINTATRTPDNQFRKMNSQMKAEGFSRFVIRMSRFTGITMIFP